MARCKNRVELEPIRTTCFGVCSAWQRRVQPQRVIASIATVALRLSDILIALDRTPQRQGTCLVDLALDSILKTWDEGGSVVAANACGGRRLE